MRSRRLHLVLPLLALAACADGTTGPTPGPTGEMAPLYMGKPGASVEGQYLVVLEDGVDPQQAIAGARVRPLRQYREAVNGFAAQLNPAQLDAVRRTPGVAFVEQDQIYSHTATISVPPSLWGIDRIDQKTRGLSGTFTYLHTGAGVNAYILDTGIQYSHPEFSSGRAVLGYDAYGGDGSDCHGHGTHTAGTVGGNAVGVAPGVKLYSVRVLDCTGNGTTTAIVAGMDWVRLNRVKPAVSNISLGGGYSKAMNQATDRLFTNYAFPVVAAGNSAAYACDYSPASAVWAFTVAAADSSDARATFSNWGRCVQLYAPGVNVLSAYPTNQYAYMSGTSMAAPHVAGVAAMYLQKFPASMMTTLADFLVRYSTPNAIRFSDTGTIMYGTPNKLLYTNGL